MELQIIKQSLLDPRRTNTNDCRGHFKRRQESLSLSDERQKMTTVCHPAALRQLDVQYVSLKYLVHVCSFLLLQAHFVLPTLCLVQPAPIKIKG